MHLGTKWINLPGKLRHSAGQVMAACLSSFKFNVSKDGAWTPSSHHDFESRNNLSLLFFPFITQVFASYFGLAPHYQQPQFSSILPVLMLPWDVKRGKNISVGKLTLASSNRNCSLLRLLSLYCEQERKFDSPMQPFQKRKRNLCGSRPFIYKKGTVPFDLFCYYVISEEENKPAQATDLAFTK